jgi:hypothetical protein
MMPMPAENTYIEIGGDASRYWSTARKQYVVAGDAIMATWLAAGRTPIQVASEEDISTTLASIGLGALAPIPQRYLVDKALIVDRLIAGAKADAAFAAFDQLPRATREKWNTRNAIYSDDPDALALLKAIGADPSMILAPP